MSTAIIIGSVALLGGAAILLRGKLNRPENQIYILFVLGCAVAFFVASAIFDDTNRLYCIMFALVGSGIMFRRAKMHRLILNIGSGKHDI